MWFLIPYDKYKVLSWFGAQYKADVNITLSSQPITQNTLKQQKAQRQKTTQKKNKYYIWTLYNFLKIT